MPAHSLKVGNEHLRTLIVVSGGSPVFIQHGDIRTLVELEKFRVCFINDDPFLFFYLAQLLGKLAMMNQCCLLSATFPRIKKVKSKVAYGKQQVIGAGATRQAFKSIIILMKS